MTGNTLARIVLAAAQARSQPGQVAATVEREPMVGRAAAQGVRLVVLPELFSCGYGPTRAVWDCAGPRDGRVGWPLPRRRTWVS